MYLSLTQLPSFLAFTFLASQLPSYSFHLPSFPPFTFPATHLSPSATHLSPSQLPSFQASKLPSFQAVRMPLSLSHLHTKPTHLPIPNPSFPPPSFPIPFSTQTNINLVPSTTHKHLHNSRPRPPALHYVAPICPHRGSRRPKYRPSSSIAQ